MNIVLIGYRGVGKTFIGADLARRLGMEFVDTDDLIEDKSGRRIPDIFSSGGEDEFRRMEKAAVREVSEKDNMVVATGGGAVMDGENVENLKRNGFIVLLEADADTILKRIGESDRPRLTGKSRYEEIKYLLDKRMPGYKKAAALSINTAQNSKDNVIEEIIRKWREIQ